MEVELASFKTSIDSISFGLTALISPPGKPSITYNGIFSAFVEAEPRITIL